MARADAALHELGRQVLAADCHQRVGLIAAYAELCQVQPATIRRRLAEAGYKVARKSRADRGVYKDPYMVDCARQVIATIRKSAGSMPVWSARDVCLRNGTIGPECDSAAFDAFVTRYMREQRYGRDPADRSGRLGRRIDWKHPGHCLQVDATNCAQWFVLEPTGRIQFATAQEVYRNKPNQPDKPIIRYIGTDAASAAFRVWYVQDFNERADNLLRFLYDCMVGDSQPESMPLRGIPDVLLLDPGPGNKSAAVDRVCELLNIDLRIHRPHQPQAKGAVEESHNYWHHAFESELRLWPAASLAELQRRADAKCRRVNATRRHRRHGLTRSAYYAQHRPAAVMPPPWDVFVECATSAAEDRQVQGGALISFRGAEYYVGNLPGVQRGDAVQVCVALLDWDERTAPIRVQYGGQVIRATALARDARAVCYDRRIYRDRQVSDAEQAHAEQLAALDQIPVPRPAVAADAGLPRVAAVETAGVVLVSAPVPRIRRLDALEELRTVCGVDELDPAFVGSLGWGELVTRSQIKTAIDLLSVQSARPRSAAAG